MVTVSVFVFIFPWNELLITLILPVGEPGTKTVTVPSLAFQTSTPWGSSAIPVLQSIPVLTSNFFVRKHQVRDLTVGAARVEDNNVTLQYEL